MYPNSPLDLEIGEDPLGTKHGGFALNATEHPHGGLASPSQPRAARRLASSSRLVAPLQ